MTKALLVIDYSIDFVADNGRLTAGKRAQAIEQDICQAVTAAYQAGDFIYFMMDAHEVDDTYHPEYPLYPAHNIKGTRGSGLYGKVADLYEKIKEESRVSFKEKTYYSAFVGTDLDSRLRERGIGTVVLAGVLTDVCILHTAISAYNLGYKVEVIEAAVAGLSDSKEAFALAHMTESLGATLL